MTEEQLRLSFEKNTSNGEESKGANQDKIAARRVALIAAVASNQLDSVERKVARILNLFPETRNSDIALQLKFWELFEPDLYGGGSITPELYYKLTRLNSITRARAKIQNTYGLYQASLEVQRQRNKIEDDEYERRKRRPTPQAVTIITLDESGKTGKVLVVGSFWCQDGQETFNLQQAISDWRRKSNFKSELHFKEINRENAEIYCRFIDFLADRLSLFSFKAITVPRMGLKNIGKAIEDLMFHLIVRGIEHENTTGRSPLPRSLQVWKDMEEEGADKMLAANLRERVYSASEARFNGGLTVDDFEAFDSKDVQLLQIADLYSGALGRLANSTRQGSNHPKDHVAQHLVQTLRLQSSPSEDDFVSDLAVRISL